MEIRFCTVCNESIPDGEFDAGRAIVSGKHSQHVACALRRTVVMSGTRSWLTFFLALFSAGVATFLLVVHLGREEGPPKIVDLPEVTESHVAAQLQATEKRLAERVDTQGAALASRLEEDFDSRITKLLSEKITAAVDVQEKRLAALSGQAQSHFQDLDRLVGKLQGRMASLLDWKVRIQEEADRLRRDIEAAAQQQQPKRVPPPTVIQPDGGTEVPAEEIDREREAEIDRWIKRLRDPDEDIVFSATIELARLKALRAWPELVKVLAKHRDFYARLGAATALGELRSADAVPSLIEALGDKDDLVRTAAAEALHGICEQDFNFLGGLSKNERIKIQKKWRQWWRENEEVVRQRLGQEAKPGK